MSRNENPTTAAATGTSRPIQGEPASGSGSGAGWIGGSPGERIAAGISRAISRAIPLAKLRAASTTSRLSSAAIQIDLRTPSTSSEKKVVASVPSTAPSVLTA